LTHIIRLLGGKPKYIYVRDNLQNLVPIYVFADDAFIYATDRKEGYVLESYSEVSLLLRRGMSAGT
jgi:hypothetical protein